MNTLEMNGDAVVIGTTVVVRDIETGDTEEYTLVPPAEADIAENRISTMTPLARAIYGKQSGDIVDVLAPGGTVRLRIESVTGQATTDGYG